MAVRIHTTEEDFTPKELEMIYMLSRGKFHKEIAQELVVSPYTVAHHIKNIRDKMNAHSIHQIVAYAFLDGIVH